MKAVLEAREAGLRAGGRTLVRGASLAVMPGSVSVIVGPNGAGKSTLLRLLSGETAPSEGAVLSLGAPLRAVPAWRLACRRAVMAQASRLTFPFTAGEVVRLGLEGVGRARRAEAAARAVGAALEAADVLALAGRDYQTLSGGEQQRVQFARVLAQLEAGRGLEPAQALLLDEPVASLDLRHQLALLERARDLARRGGVGVLAVLHDLDLAARYADHLVVMAGGAIVAAGSPARVLTAELGRAVFGVELRILREEAGAGLRLMLA